ncbi:hypothetical protein L596_001418 [Steinernema carpocapsae]|uniref:Uncharacterized protein n=1 Tax=Steinernema carpocapsae TaxID=34508 RepID=A0A4U8UQ78_STECR|nr:hypothetical protein L596_001418 [Steinernema carpocapsae]
MAAPKTKSTNNKHNFKRKNPATNRKEKKTSVYLSLGAQEGVLQPAATARSLMGDSRLTIRTRRSATNNHALKKIKSLMAPRNSANN